MPKTSEPRAKTPRAKKTKAESGETTSDKVNEKPSERIRVRRLANERLLDERIVKRTGKTPFWGIVITLMVLVLGIYAIGYYLIYLPSLEEEYTPPQIVLPNETQNNEVPQPISTQEPEQKVSVPMVKILETPINSLNVRRGPGTNYEKIGQVTPGQTFELVQYDQAAGWYEIKLGPGGTGWVTKEYSQVIEP